MTPDVAFARDVPIISLRVGVNVVFINEFFRFGGWFSFFSFLFWLAEVLSSELTNVVTESAFHVAGFVEAPLH